MSNLGITPTHYKMNTVTQNLLHIFLVVLLVACSSDSKQLALLDGAESVMTSAPDSALTLLREIKSNKLNRADNARYALLLSQALDKNYIDVTDDSLINIAVEYYKHKNDEYLFTAYYYKGRVLENARNLHGAMHLYTCAEQLIENIDDNYAKGLLYARIGGLYNEFYDLPLSLDAYNKALEYYKIENKQPIIYHTILSISGILINMKEFSQAEIYLNECLEWGISNNNDKIVYKAFMLSSNLYKQTQDIKKLVALTSSSHYEPFIDEFWALSSQALILGSEGKMQEANLFIERAQKLSQNISDTINILYDEYCIQSNYGNPALALKSFEKITQYQDSIVRISLQQPLLSVQCDYYQSQAELQALQLKFNQMCIVVFAIILIMAIVCIVLYIRNIFKNLALKDAVIDQYINDVEELRCTINRKEDTIDNMTTQINDLFSQQFQLIDDLTKTYYENNMHSRNKEVIYNSVKECIEEFSSKQQIQKLESVVNRNKQNIMEIARREISSLSEQDFRLLCYFYAGFSGKAISVFTGNTINNIYIRKFRIKAEIEKLDDSLRNFLLKNLP